MNDKINQYNNNYDGYHHYENQEKYNYNELNNRNNSIYENLKDIVNNNNNNDIESNNIYK